MCFHNWSLNNIPYPSGFFLTWKRAYLKKTRKIKKLTLGIWTNTMLISLMLNHISVKLFNHELSYCWHNCKCYKTEIPSCIIASCPKHVAYCILLDAFCWLPIVSCLLPYWWLSNVAYILLPSALYCQVCNILHIAWCLLHIVHCLLPNADSLWLWPGRYHKEKDTKQIRR